MEAPHRVVESVRQAAEERESTSESSASSTLSHYTECAGPGLQQGYSEPGAQSATLPAQSHPPEGGYGQQKPGYQPPLNPSAGHSMGAVPSVHQQPPYSQPVQTLPQQLHYAAQQQIPSALIAMPAAQTTVTGSVADYLQHPHKLQTLVGPGLLGIIFRHTCNPQPHKHNPRPLL